MVFGGGSIPSGMKMASYKNYSVADIHVPVFHVSYNP